MSDFPRTKQEALALLYMQSQDLSGLTPKEILEKYDSAYKEICDAKPSASYNPVHGRF
ncbi:MAG: hypothetical protein ACLTXM_15670 [Enterococcus sp.]